MRILVLGAGATGGYFGGRLAEGGADVTFLVREKRREQLAEKGLQIFSVNGDVTLQPKLITQHDEAEPFDLVLLTMKAYHLDSGLDSIEPFVGERTMILPLLNGMLHMDKLQQRFGSERVLGGLCFIETTLDQNGAIRQTSPTHQLVYGEWQGGTSERIKKLEKVFAVSKAPFTASQQIVTDMWHKYLFITVLSGITTLFQSAVGPIRESVYGRELIQQLFTEVASVMRASGAPIADDIVEKQMNTMEKQGYNMKASMLRDMEKQAPIEADHLQGYLLQLADEHQVDTPLLRVVYNNLKVYERKRDNQ